MRYLLLSTLVALSFTSKAQVPEYVPTEGLIAWYPMDGNALDASDNQHHGIVSGATQSMNRFGQPLQAYSFDGVNDKISIDDGIPLNLVADWSISFWMQPETGIDTIEYPHVFEWDDPGSGVGLIVHRMGEDAYPASGGQMECYMTDFSGYQNPSVSPRIWNALPSVGEWSHAVIVRVDGEITFFLNGEEKTTLTSSDFGLEELFVSRLTIGASMTLPDWPVYWKGLLDDLGFWQKGLTEADVAALYLAPGPLMGCTDSEACNYDPAANVDDGSCLELDACGECGGEGIAGCTVPEACNYSPIASCDDGGCVYPPAIDLGVDIETCDESVTLDAGPGFENYLWTTGDTSQVILVQQSGEYGVSGTIDLEQLEQDALVFDGQNDYVVISANPSFNFESSLSFGVWVKVPPGSSGWDTVLGGYYDHGINIYAGSGNADGAVRAEIPGVLTLTSITDLRDNQWHHVMVVYDGSAVSIWIDGQIEISEEAAGNITPNHDGGNYNLYLGRGNHVSGEFFEGAMAFPELWNIALSPESIQSHFQCPPSGEETGLVALWQFDENNGVLVPDASGTGSDGQIVGAAYSSDVPSELCSTQCDMSASDTINVQLFTYSCLCGEGTVWDEVLGECVGEISSENACYDGTIWSETVGACIVANPSDTDFDGCVSMTDLLDLLTVFGTCAEEELEEDPEVAEWSCGDPLEYQGYDYGTVQIGEQCWFAENLRSGNYLNGDVIPSGLDDADWTGGYEGATATYDLGLYGRLYNWYAVDDQRGLCPDSWHVSTNEDWAALASEIVSHGYLGIEGRALKATYGWLEGGAGTDVYGFSALPGGARHAENGLIYNQGFGGDWWTPSSHHLFLLQTSDLIGEGMTDKHFGFSVRCIQDSE